MPRGDKSSYTNKRKRQAEHIEEGYEHRGVSEKEAERRAWASVNKETHGGKRSGAAGHAMVDFAGRRTAQVWSWRSVSWSLLPVCSRVQAPRLRSSEAQELNKEELRALHEPASRQPVGCQG